MLPDWMMEGPGTTAIESRRPKNSNKFLSKTILHINQAIRDDLVTEYYASQEGLWQKIDPRLKLVSTLALIIMAGLTRNLWVLLVLWACTVLMMYASKLPILVFQKRVWGIIPLLTLLAAVPGMFNILIDGTPLLLIYKGAQPATWLGIHLPQTVYITRQGFMAGLFLFGRVGISISLGVLLAVTTPVASLMRALRVLRVPALFVMIIDMTYRYLVLLLNTAVEMVEARSLRIVGEMPLARKRNLVGSSIAVLFAKSMILSEEVYQAMTARCYTGEAVAADRFAWGRIDTIWAVTAVALIIGLVIGECLVG